VSLRVVSAPWILTGASPAPPGADPRLSRGRDERVAPGAGVLRDAALALEDDAIVAVGPRDDVESRFGPAERLDAVLFPALVNAHTHLELSHLHGQVPGGEGLPGWVRLLLAARASHPDPGYAIRHAVLSMQELGVAAVGDVSNTLATVAHLNAVGVAGTVFHEVFGFSRRRIELALEQAQALASAAAPPAPGLRVVLSPHAVYSTHADVLAKLLRAGPASIHLAEDPAERRFCAEGAGPFAGLNHALGAIDIAPFARSAVAAAAPHLHPGSLAVHVIDLDDEDVAALAASGATAVLCPRSNLHIGGRLADLPRLLAAGVPLAVGTDSLASAPSLSPLAELAVLREAYPEISAARLLPLAWAGAAVGAPAVGHLAVGSAPGVLAAPLDGARPDDPAEWLVATFGAEERRVQWIARHRPAPHPEVA
jgi:cytosine/adenosine deaminase-related metal-dependent hydrolase